MAEPIFALNHGDLSAHFLIVGTSGRGKSSFGDTEPTEEQRRASAERKAQAERKRQARLTAVCEAYWAGTDPDSAEFSSMADSLLDVFSISVTREQLKALLLVLPEELVGQGIAWGFDDTEVRDAIYDYVKRSHEKVRTALGI